ncbi:MAG TPA: capreomycidine synthase [Pyrinomonadaceae bacterium]|jgi:capreomycidine synthase
MLDEEVLLESWMRQYYFDTDLDIGSSGVESYSMAELRGLTGLTREEMDAVVFDDSRTLGDPLLRETIARRWGTGDPERVMATHGSSEAIFLVLNALLSPGDEVVILDPIYPQFYSIAQSLGARLKSWRLRAERGFRPDVGEAKSLIGPRTKAVVVNFPHNPTGASLTREELSELVAATSAVGAYLVWDAAFAGLTYDDAPLPDPTLSYERAISVGTLSKGFGLPGLRVGWCLAPPEVLERCALLRDYINLHLSPLVELVARRAVEHADELCAIRLRQARANLGLLSAWAAEHAEYVELTPPRGGVCAFPRLRGISDTEAFCHQLARARRVLLVPGRCFDAPQHVRLGFGGRTEAFEEGLRRLGAQLRSHARN